MAKVQAYISTLQESAGYAALVMVPYQLDGVDGIILLMSAAQSTRQLSANSVTVAANGLVTDPHWAYFEVCWYPGLVTLNFRGIPDPQYQATKTDENL